VRLSSITKLIDIAESYHPASIKFTGHQSLMPNSNAMAAPSLRLVFVILLGNHFFSKCFSFKSQLFNSFLRTHHISSSRTTTVYSDNTVLHSSGEVFRNENFSGFNGSPTRLARPEKNAFHSEINKIFPNDGYLVPNSDKRMRQNDVDKLIYHHLPEFNQASISTLMYRSAKEWKKTKVSVVSRHIPRITSYMSRLPSDGWTAKDIANCIYGLQYMRSDEVNVLKFLSVMSNIVLESLCADDEECDDDDDDEEALQISDRENKIFQSKLLPFIPTTPLAGLALDRHTLALNTANQSPASEPTLQTKILSARELSTMLYSLRGMRSDVKEVKVFLNSLNRALFLCNNAGVGFDVQGVSNALYGLQGMNSDCSEVRTLVTLLTSRIAGCKECLDSQAIGNALYGLKNMNSEYPEVRLLLKVLAIKINESPAEMRSQEIANALYGLQGMNSNHGEIKEVLTALESKINNSKRGQSFNAQEIGNALYGLQSMNSDSPEVRKLLLAITKKMNNYDVVLNAQAVGCALIGLQGLNSDHAEVNKLLSVLTKHVSNSEIIDEKAVGSLFGLQRMNVGSDQVRELLVVFSKKLDLCLGRLNVDEIAFALYGLQNIVGDENPCKEVTIFLSSLIRQIKRSVYLSSNFDDIDVIENRASRTVESVISSIKSVKHMCGSSTQLAPQEIMSLLVVAECS
jgi:hypothetical protein